MKNKILVATSLIVLAGCGAEEETTTGTSTKPATPLSVAFSKPTLDLKEGDTANQTDKIIISANRNVESDVVITYKAVDGTAVSGVDFVAFNSSITILKNTRTAEISVSTIANTTHQKDRDFKLTITDAKIGSSSVEKTTDSVTVRITDDDPEPNVQFITDSITAHEDIGVINIPVQLDRLSSKETLVRMSLGGISIRDSDYSVDGFDLKIPPMTSRANFPIKILKDVLVEGTETIDLTMTLLVNAKQGTRKATKVFISGDLHLPDTAVVRYFNNGSLTSTTPDVNHPYQDAAYGHDTNPAYSDNGEAGFVYQKIDFAGNVLPVDTYQQVCTYDSHTGLTWEVKNGPDNQWSNASFTYLWNNSDNKTNGGSAGGINAKEFTDVTEPASAHCAFPSKTSPLYLDTTANGCTSANYTALFNKAAICGFKDWRLPSIAELTTIVSYNQESTALDKEYFKDASSIASSPDVVSYLSSTPSADNSASVWCFNATDKKVWLCNKQTYQHIRMVRGPKL